MEEERPWSNLPVDVLGLILPHVYDQSPYLLNIVEDESKCILYHPVFGKTYYEEDLDFQYVRNRIVSSNFGWLLLDKGYCFLYFYHPFTHDHIDVPPISDDWTSTFNIFHFSSPPTSSDSTIVAMKNWNVLSAGTTDIAIFKAGDQDWTILNFQNEFTTSFCNPIFIDGCYYFMGEECNMGIFNVKGHRWKVCDEHLVPCSKAYRYRPIGMAEDNNGGILLVYETRQHKRLFVSRFDLSKKIWEKIDCLGDDKVLYVSRGASYMETVEAKGLGNIIYLPKFHGMNGVFYSLTTNKYHSCDGSFCSEASYGLVQSPFSTWIKHTRTYCDGCSFDTRIKHTLSCDVCSRSQHSSSSCQGTSTLG